MYSSALIIFVCLTQRLIKNEKKEIKFSGFFFSLCMYLGMNISSQLFVIDIFLQEVLEEIKKN